MPGRILLALLGALLLSATAASGCEESCDPGSFLISDCGAEETCDAETNVCEDRQACATSDDCPGGYVCYDEGTCARNCNSGLFFMLRYCKPGFTCDEQYRCVPPPQLVATACERSCGVLAEQCVSDPTAREVPTKLCIGECVDEWALLSKDVCVGAEALNDYFRCIGEAAEKSQSPECTAPLPAQWLNPTNDTLFSSLWAAPPGCARPTTSGDFGVEVTEDGCTLP